MATMKRHAENLRLDLEDSEVFEIMATQADYDRIAAQETDPTDWALTDTDTDTPNANTTTDTHYRSGKRCFIALRTRRRQKRLTSNRIRAQRLRSTASGHHA